LLMSEIKCAVLRDGRFHNIMTFAFPVPSVKSRSTRQGVRITLRHKRLLAN
jgi:hypothetical protein